MCLEFNSDIMLIQVEHDVAGKINVMGSGDVMSRRVENVKYESEK
jgi:hypothetical protein